MDSFEVRDMLHRAVDSKAQRQPLGWERTAVQQIHLRIDAASTSLDDPTEDQVRRAEQNVSELITSAFDLAKISGAATIDKTVVTTLLAQKMGRWPF